MTLTDNFFKWQTLQTDEVFFGGVYCASSVRNFPAFGCSTPSCVIDCHIVSIEKLVFIKFNASNFFDDAEIDDSALSAMLNVIDNLKVCCDNTNILNEWNSPAFDTIKRLQPTEPTSRMKRNDNFPLFNVYIPMNSTRKVSQTLQSGIPNKNTGDSGVLTNCRGVIKQTTADTNPLDQFFGSGKKVEKGASGVCACANENINRVEKNYCTNEHAIL
uniref:Uncharacterized protein n=1 Tax=Romanomermis culicivorax TaxID=13658 RepID=A0A915L340_ROMCU